MQWTNTTHLVLSLSGTLNAALWTTMAEISEQDDNNKVCLVLEKIPVSALLAFAEDFTVLKTQGRLMQYLPELERFSVSVLGKGTLTILVQVLFEISILFETHLLHRIGPCIGN